jgi:hypothetical protein
VITLTTFTDTRAVGTFSGTLAPGSMSAARTTAVVANGSFDLTF